MLSIHSDAHSTNTDAHNDTHDQDSDDDDDDSSSPSCSSVASDDSFPSLDFSLFEGDRVHDRVPGPVAHPDDDDDDSASLGLVIPSIVFTRPPTPSAVHSASPNHNSDSNAHAPASTNCTVPSTDHAMPSLHALHKPAAPTPRPPALRLLVFSLTTQFASQEELMRAADASSPLPDGTSFASYSTAGTANDYSCVPSDCTTLHRTAVSSLLDEKIDAEIYSIHVGGVLNANVSSTRADRHSATPNSHPAGGKLMILRGGTNATKVHACAAGTNAGDALDSTGEAQTAVEDLGRGGADAGVHSVVFGSNDIEHGVHGVNGVDSGEHSADSGHHDADPGNNGVGSGNHDAYSGTRSPDSGNHDADRVSINADVTTAHDANPLATAETADIVRALLPVLHAPFVALDAVLRPADVHGCSYDHGGGGKQDEGGKDTQEEEQGQGGAKEPTRKRKRRHGGLNVLEHRHEHSHKSRVRSHESRERSREQRGHSHEQSGHSHEQRGHSREHRHQDHLREIAEHGHGHRHHHHRHHHHRDYPHALQHHIPDHEQGEGSSRRSQSSSLRVDSFGHGRHTTHAASPSTLPDTSPPTPDPLTSLTHDAAPPTFVHSNASPPVTVMHDASPLAAHDPPSVLALAGTPEARLWSALLFVVRGNAPTPREAALAAALDVHVPVVFVGVGDGGRAATDGDGGGDVGGGSSRDGHGEEGQDNGNGGEHGEHAQDDGERGHAERAHAHVERELGYLEGLPTQDGVNGLDNHNELDEHEYDDDFAGSFPGSASSSFLSFPTSLASSMYAPRDPSPLSRASEALSTSLSHLPSQPSLLPPSQHGPWTASAHAGSMPLAHVAPPTAPSQAPPLTSAHAVLPVSAYAAFDVLPRSALRTQLPSPETLRARAAERFVAWRDGRLGECSAVGAGRGINGMGDGGRMDGFDDGREILRVDDGRPVRRIARPRANAWKHDWEAFLARQALLAPPRLHERQAFHTSTKPAHKHTETSRRTRAGSYHPTRPDSPPPSSSKPTFPSRRSDTRMRGPLTDPLHLPSLLRLLLRACAASGKDAFAAPGQYAFAAPGRHAHGSFGSTLAPSYASTSTNSVMWLSFGLGLGLGLGVLLRGWM